eukprot:7825886-Alexandrium_andersonii.AAC.1
MANMKPIPRDVPRLLALAAEEEPQLSWSGPAPETDWRAQLHCTKDDCMARAVRSLRGKCGEDHLAFAGIVADQLGGHFIVERDDKEIL